jgi:hypothetical protein
MFSVPPLETSWPDLRKAGLRQLRSKSWIQSLADLLSTATMFNVYILNIPMSFM